MFFPFLSFAHRLPGFWSGVALLWACGSILSAQELPEVFTQSAPFTNTAETPAWVTFSTETAISFGNLSVQLTPPPSASKNLLLTVVFEEQPNGFLRAYQQTGTESQTLADNLMEGVSGINQRTILLKALSTTSPTTVTFLTGSANLSIKRLVFTWTKPISVLADATQPAPPAMRGSVGLRDSDINGSDYQAPSIQFGHNFVSAPLQETPESLVDGITFVVTLPKAPNHVRLTCEVLSPILGQRFFCRINGLPAPDITPFPPSLNDPAYFPDATPPFYAGWMPAAIYLPGTLWQSGENVIELTPVGFDGLPSKNFVGLKNTTLEVVFPAEAAPSEPTSSN